jgi:hypothetical protein
MRDQASDASSKIWKPQGCHNVWLSMADDNSFSLVFERMRMSALQADSDSEDDEENPHRYEMLFEVVCS